jgi:hypothetical protein
MTLIAKIKAVSLKRGLKAHVTIVSDGKKKDLMEFEDLGALIRLHGDPLDDFMCLQYSDVFLMAKGSFSYFAGYLHLGKCVSYEPWYYLPLQIWILADTPEGALLDRLQQHDFVDSAVGLTCR